MVEKYTLKNPIIKPWGFEFEYFDNSLVSVWVLQLGTLHKSGYVLGSSRTSLHMHSTKCTSVICIDGVLDVVYLSGSKRLYPSEHCTIPPTRFHRLQAYIGKCVAIEIETPSNRDDIIRLEDDHGRQGKGYDWDLTRLFNPSLVNFKLSNNALFYKEKQYISQHVFDMSNKYSPGNLFVPTANYVPIGYSSPLLIGGYVYSTEDLGQVFSSLRLDENRLTGLLIK